MTAFGRGFDLLIGFVGVAAWGLAVYAFGSRLVSPTVASVLAVAMFMAGFGMVVGWQMQDSRARKLAAGQCPSCRTAIRAEHRHRAWEPGRAEWSTPMLIWDCPACGFSQSEVWACPACPAKD